MRSDLTILHDAPGSASHAAARAIARYAPADITVSLGELDGLSPDVDRALGATTPEQILLLSHSAAPLVRAALVRRRAATTLVTAFHAGWPGDLPAFFAAYEASDHLLISNRDYWERTGRLPGTAVVPWGFDADVFQLQRPIESRRHRVLWTGPAGEAARTGYDRLLKPLEHELETWWQFGCELLPIDPSASSAPPPEEMAAWYNTGTIFVCPSRSEGTPASALEAASCGCTIVSTRVGCLPELIVDGENGYLVDRDPGAILRGIEAATKNYPRLAARMQEDIGKWRWRQRAPDFYDALQEAGSHQAPTSVRESPVSVRPDLSADVTVFVTSIGAPSYAACRELLRRQDCTFTLDLVQGITPLSAALQQMLDRCETPYYVQVDEDMLLFPHAVRVLYERLSSSPPDVAMAVGGLYDVHLERSIQGVKIARHAIARRYPWTDEPSVLRRLARLDADGYRVVELSVDDPDGRGGTVGLHATHATPDMLYDRYLTLERLRRSVPNRLEWFEPFATVFLQRFLADGTEADLQALLGILAGARAGPLPQGAEIRDGSRRRAAEDLRLGPLASRELNRDGER